MMRTASQPVFAANHDAAEAPVRYPRMSHRRDGKTLEYRNGIMTSNLFLTNSKLVYYDKTSPLNQKLQKQQQSQDKLLQEKKTREAKDKENKEKFGSLQHAKRLLDSSIHKKKQQEQEEKDKTEDENLLQKFDEDGNVKLTKKQKLVQRLNYAKAILTTRLFMDTTAMPLEKKFIQLKVLNNNGMPSFTNVLIPMWKDYDNELQEKLKMLNKTPQQQQQIAREQAQNATAYTSPFKKPNYFYTHLLQQANIFMMLDQQNLAHELIYMAKQLNAEYFKHEEEAANAGGDEVLKEDHIRDPPQQYQGVPTYYLTSPL